MVQFQMVQIIACPSLCQSTGMSVEVLAISLAIGSERVCINWSQRPLAIGSDRFDQSAVKGLKNWLFTVAIYWHEGTLLARYLVYCCTRLL